MAGFVSESGKMFWSRSIFFLHTINTGECCTQEHPVMLVVPMEDHTHGTEKANHPAVSKIFRSCHCIRKHTPHGFVLWFSVGIKQKDIKLLFCTNLLPENAFLRLCTHENRLRQMMQLCPHKARSRSPYSCQVQHSLGEQRT